MPEDAMIIGTAIKSRLFELGWIMRMPTTRALVVTDEGHTGFLDRFNISVKD